MHVVPCLHIIAPSGPGRRTHTDSLTPVPDQGQSRKTRRFPLAVCSTDAGTAAHRITHHGETGRVLLPRAVALSVESGHTVRRARFSAGEQLRQHLLEAREGEQVPLSFEHGQSSSS